MRILRCRPGDKGGANCHSLKEAAGKRPTEHKSVCQQLLRVIKGEGMAIKEVDQAPRSARLYLKLS